MRKFKDKTQKKRPRKLSFLNNSPYKPFVERSVSLETFRK